MTAFITLLYFAAIISVSIWAGRLEKSMKGFFVTSGRAGSIMLAFGVSGSWLSASGLLGGGAFAYKYGYPSLIQHSFVFIGVTIAWVLIAKRVRQLSAEHGFITMADFFEWRYPSPYTRPLVAVITAVFACVLLIAQYKALGVVTSQALGIPYVWGMVLGMVILGGYTVVGGMLGSLMANVIQGFLGLVIGIMIFLLGLNLVGGFTSMHEVVRGVDPQFLQLWWSKGRFDFPYFIALIPNCLSVMFWPHVFTKIYTVRNTFVLRWGLLLTVAMMIVSALPKFAGLAATALVAQGVMPPLKDPDQVLPFLVMKFLPPAATGLLLAGILATIMSGLDSLLLQVGSVLARDVYQKLLRVELSRQREVLVSRAFTVAALVVTLLVALKPPDLISWIAYAAYAFMTSCFFVPGLLGLLWARVTTAAFVASASVGLGLSLVLGWFELVPHIRLFGVYMSIWGLAISSLIVVVVTLFTQQKASTNKRQPISATLGGK